LENLHKAKDTTGRSVERERARDRLEPENVKKKEEKEKDVEDRRQNSTI
jgi:hypothetical protein